MSNNILKTIVKRLVNKIDLLFLKIVMEFGSQKINEFLKEMLEFDQKTMEKFLMIPELYISLLSERGPKDIEKRKIAIYSMYNAKSPLHIKWTCRIACISRLVNSSYEKYKCAVEAVNNVKNEINFELMHSVAFYLSNSDVTYGKFKCAINFTINARNDLCNENIGSAITNSFILNASDEKYIYVINAITNAKNVEYAKIIESILWDPNFINNTTDKEFNNILNLISNVNLESASLIMDFLTVIFGFNMKLSNFDTEKLLIISNLYEFYLNKKKDDLKEKLSDEDLINFKSKFLAAIIEKPNIIDTLSDRIKIFKSNQGIELNSSEILKILKENEQSFNDVSQKFSSNNNKSIQSLYEEYLASLENKTDLPKVENDVTLKKERK
jgi:hypothetical protein